MSINLDFRINLLTILLIVALIAILILRPFSAPSDASHIDWDVIHSFLESHHYVQADPVNKPKPHNLSPEVKDVTSSSVSGSGTWSPDTEITPSDTLEVALSVVTLDDGTAWATVTIDSKPVVIHQLDYYHQEIRRRWLAHVEVCNCETSLAGVGLGYNLFDVAGVDVIPSVTVATRGDWIAPEVRFSRNIWSGVSASGGAGYRFGVERGLHLSAGISVEL